MIRMNDFRAEPEPLRREMLEAVERVVRSGWYVLGEEGRAFEQEWAEACGLPARGRAWATAWTRSRSRSARWTSGPATRWSPRR